MVFTIVTMLLSTVTMLFSSCYHDVYYSYHADKHFYHWEIFIELHPNVPLSDTMYRTYDKATQTQRKGHTSRSCPLHISWTLWTVFNELHSNVPLSETVVAHMTQLPWLMVTGQGVNLEFRVCSISPYPFVGFSLNCTQMFLSVRQWLHRLKFKVMWFTLQFVSTPYLQTYKHLKYTMNHPIILLGSCLIWSILWSRSHFKVMWFTLNFLSAPYLLNPSNDFH